jgi:hypothetical protein
VKRSPLLRRTPLARSSKLVTAQPLARLSHLKRSTFKRKRRRPKSGDHPAYKAWVKTQACVVGGHRCGRAEPHHIIDGRGAQRKGMGQTARDRDALPLCRAHHNEFHDGNGFCQGWSKEQRRVFQEQEIERLNKIWDDLCELGVLQEPMREAI